MPKVGAETGGKYGSLLLPGAQRASIIRTLNQKVCQKRVPSTRKSAPRTPAGVKNAYPQAKSASKTRTLNPKVRPPRPRRASKTRTLSKKVRQKHVPRTLSPKVRPPDPGGRQKRVPSSKKCVKNAYPQPKNAPPIPRRVSKTRTLSQKVRQKHVPSARKSMHPFRK